jgi:circadian clock protein KaiB
LTNVRPTELEPLFRLFVAGRSPNSAAALRNILRALEALGRGHTDLEVVDVYDHPGIALEFRVMVTPTLLARENPEQRLIGDLSAQSQLQDFLK